MDWYWWVGIAVVVVVALDRVMVHLEKRGLVRWRHVPTRTWGGVLDGLPDAFNPGHQLVVEQRQWEEVRVDEGGDVDPLSPHTRRKP